MPAAPEIEKAVVAHFADLGRMIGAPRSLGAIYGFLFISAAPVAFDQVVRSVHLSTGSVSQGLKILREIGAVRTTSVAGDRRDHYLAETSLRSLVGGFLRGGLAGELLEGETRLQRLREAAEKRRRTSRDSDGVVAARLEKLQSWHAQARAVIPALLSMLETPGS